MIDKITVSHEELSEWFYNLPFEDLMVIRSLIDIEVTERMKTEEDYSIN